MYVLCVEGQCGAGAEPMMGEKRGDGGDEKKRL
jgi:hypothetical protein